MSDFPTFVNLLNRQLKPLGMELARGTMEDTGQKWYGLVNRSDDPAAKIATAYSPAELELFNKAVSLSLHDVELFSPSRGRMGLEKKRLGGREAEVERKRAGGERGRRREQGRGGRAGGRTDGYTITHSNPIFFHNPIPELLSITITSLLEQAYCQFYYSGTSL